jgi:hypothetical protein
MNITIPKTNPAIADLLELAKKIQIEAPIEELEKLPLDGALNHDHYLYDAPKKQ